MSNNESIYLVVLCVGLLASIAFAYTGFRQLRGLEDQIAAEKRLVVYLLLASSLLMVVSAGFSVIATLEREAASWRPFLVILSLAVASTFLSGVVARQVAVPPSA